MKVQFENRVMSSFMLWFDHTLLKKGEAFTNHGSNFYNIDALYYGYKTYGAPFKQFVTDSSIPNAVIISGVYIGGNTSSHFKKTGQSPLVDINYEQGQVYFNDTESATISGNYSVKDFNVYLTSKAEQELLFENKIELTPSTIQVVTGLAPSVATYPAVFIKNNGGNNEPFSFGGMDRTELNLRAIVLSDSQFKLDAACSIFKDQVRTYVPIVSDENFPFNALGGLKTSVYNYESLIAGIGENSKAFISKVEISRFSLGYMENLNNTNPDIFKALIDFELETMRYPREG